MSIITEKIISHSLCLFLKFLKNGGYSFVILLSHLVLDLIHSEFSYSFIKIL